MPQYKIDNAINKINTEKEKQIIYFEKEKKLIEAQRIKMRTEYDLEMLKELGYCNGVENYSQPLSNRSPGDRPDCLLDYFPDGFLTIIDESHVTLPQIRGMFNGDRSRKLTLVENGFRLPSALDNRPLNFDEFINITNELIFSSATPGKFEVENSSQIIEQIIRPTGIIEPPVEIRPLKNQIDNLIDEIRYRVERKERSLVTTLTKKTAEDLTLFLKKINIQVQYIHSDVDAIERVEILRNLRKGDVDCVVGINLLREGLDLPEVSLVAILDADKEGFLRSETSLIQTAGRAARHLKGLVIMYADNLTNSMQNMIKKCDQRRIKQLEYNQKNNLKPKAINKPIQKSLKDLHNDEDSIIKKVLNKTGKDFNINEIITQTEKDMLEAAEKMEFEHAAILRDRLNKLKEKYD